MDMCTTYGISNLLVSEDDAVLIRFYQQALLECCSNLKVTDSPNEAMEILKSESIDFLITDLKIAEKNGVDIMHCAVKHNPEIKILVASGYVSDHEYQDKLKDFTNIKGFLQKPFTVNTLLEKIASITGVGGNLSNQ